MSLRMVSWRGEYGVTTLLTMIVDNNADSRKQLPMS